MGMIAAPKAKTTSVSVNKDKNTTLLTIRQFPLKRATDRVQKCISPEAHRIDITMAICRFVKCCQTHQHPKIGRY